MAMFPWLISPGVFINRDVVLPGKLTPKVYDLMQRGSQFAPLLRCKLLAEKLKGNKIV